MNLIFPRALVCFILLILSIVCFGAQESRVTAPSSVASNSLDNLRSPQNSIDKKEEANKKNESNKEEERQNRDLAAQEQMAFWAKYSFYVVTLGTIFSGAGFAALLYSLLLNRGALDAAKNAVIVAREANDAQSRAWISISCSLGKPERNIAQNGQGVSGIFFNVICQAKNHGHAPATGVIFNAQMLIPKDGDPSNSDHLNFFCEKIRDRASPEAEAIFPDSSGTFTHMVFISDKDIEEALEKRSFKYIAPILLGCLSYWSPSINSVRQTRFVYHVGCVGENGHASVLMPEIEGWLDKPIFVMSPGTLTCD